MLFREKENYSQKEQKSIMWPLMEKHSLCKLKRCRRLC